MIPISIFYILISRCIIPILCKTDNPYNIDLAIVFIVYYYIPLFCFFYSISNKLPPKHNYINVIIIVLPSCLNTWPP